MTTAKKFILIGVSEWGYGPISTLKPVLDQLKDYYEIIIYVKSSHVINFIKTNCNYIKFFINDYTDLMLLKNINLVLSCMHIGVLLFAKKYNIPAYCIDNLYYFWNWGNNDFHKFYIILNNNDISNPETYKKLQALPNYGAYIAMYTLSKNIFIQKYCNNYNLNKLFKNKILEIPPIIKKIKINNLHSNKHGILISFSGLITPYSTENNILLYMTFIKKILYNILISYNKDILITVPKDVLLLAKKVFTNFKINITSLSQQDFFTEMSNRRLLFVPCGFSTTYEAMYYKIPLIFLPEFQDGNFHNYLGMGNFNNFTIKKMKKIFPGLFIKEFSSSSKYISVNDLYKEYNIYIHDKLLIRKYRKYISFITYIFYKNYIEKFSLQKNFLSKKTNNFNGENIIINAIKRRDFNV